MATTSEVERVLAEIIIRQLRLSPGAVLNHTDHLEDLGLDSLGMLAFIASIEKEFGVTVSDEAYEGLTTFADALALVTGQPR